MLGPRTVVALLGGALLLGCPAEPSPPSSDTSATAGGSGSSSTSSADSTTTEGATATTGDPTGVCTCFHTSSESFWITCPFEAGYQACGTYEHCTLWGGEDSGGECPSPELEAANAEVVECTLALLAAGEAGTFGDLQSDSIGQFAYADDYIANGDGTVLVWGFDQEDLDTSVTAVRLRNAPSAAAVETCAAEQTTEAQWECIEQIMGGGALIETCTEAVSWSDI